MMDNFNKIISSVVINNNLCKNNNKYLKNEWQNKHFFTAHKFQDEFGSIKNFMIINNKINSELLLSSSKESDSPNCTDHCDINDQFLMKKKKKKRKHVTICTTNCKYDVVRRVAAMNGMKDVTEYTNWNLYWTDTSISVERAKEMKRFQKINHFPGMIEICRKDLLARNLNRMSRLFPKDYNFYPKTWSLPADYLELLSYSKGKKHKTYILKPESGCQGRGIFLTKSLRELKSSDRMICQVYLSKPFLIDGYKFDMRIYVLVTSCDPLRIFIYNEGLVRLATNKYKEPTNQNLSNIYMHLTNYSVNKHNPGFISDEMIGSKRKISTLNNWLNLNQIDSNDLWNKIDEVVVKTVLTAHPILKHTYHTCFPTHDMIYACFEILGFDILIDFKLKPFLLEVNHSPSFHTETSIDKAVKESLLRDTFNMMNFHQYDKKKILEEDRQRVRNRLRRGTNNPGLNHSGSSKSTSDFFKEQFKWEDENMGNYRRVYPTLDDDKYEQFFNQGINSMVQNTATSRARQEASKMLREGAMKSKERARSWMNRKTFAESPKSTPNSTSTTKSLSSASSAKQSVDDVQSSCRRNVLSSFLPEVINEFDEKERIKLLTQRENLIKSHGILEQIYKTMKKNGTLRPVDIKKYELCGKLSHKFHLNENISSINNKNVVKIHPNLLSG